MCGSVVTEKSLGSSRLKVERGSKGFRKCPHNSADRPSTRCYKDNTAFISQYHESCSLSDSTLFYIPVQRVMAYSCLV